MRRRATTTSRTARRSCISRSRFLRRYAESTSNSNPAFSARSSCTARVSGGNYGRAESHCTRGRKEASGHRRKGRTTRTRACPGVHRPSSPGFSIVSRDRVIRGTRRVRMARFDARCAHTRAFPSLNPHRAHARRPLLGIICSCVSGGDGAGHPSALETAWRVRQAHPRAGTFASVPKRAPAGESVHAVRSWLRISRGSRHGPVDNPLGPARCVPRVPGEARPDVHIPFPAAAFLALHAVAPGNCLSWSEHQLRSE